ncbi:hypothetical protein IV203_015350 [Nitzschia inconspicua]|uniref:Uncharacterized protein n=1 Tax=Nitzschia inconspicua TaxID=303405 RepID=A0A9K3LCH5_9STRA|nr:hypothetical protein IV203_015350 [Nitzschia inconspicua]
MGNKVTTLPLHSTHDSSVATNFEESSTGCDEVNLETEREVASLFTNGSAIFLALEEEKCVKPKMKKRRKLLFITPANKASRWLCHPPCPFGIESMLSILILIARGSTSVLEGDAGRRIKYTKTI